MSVEEKESLTSNHLLLGVINSSNTRAVDQVDNTLVRFRKNRGLADKKKIDFGKGE